ncbi:MAG TPA: ATP-binding protein [Spirochaetia bacterium]|nr:ATP-binding protein [Spirochaetia bacterium]
MSKRDVLRHFGLNRLGHYNGATFKKAVSEVVDAIRDNEMLAIVGDPGVGKSTVFREAVRELTFNPDTAPTFIYVNDWFRERMTIANIMNAILEDLKVDNIRHCMEARSRQTVKALGEATGVHYSRRSGRIEQTRQVSVVIEQGHRLHLNTLIALKELREATFAGRDRLCSVILLGHQDMKTKMMKRDEIALRTEFLMLDEDHGWMTLDERVRYIEAVYGKAVTPEARKRIALRKRTPLEIQHYLQTKMRSDMLAGYDVIDKDAVEETIQEKYEALGVSYNAIANEAKMSKTTVSNVFKGKAEHLVPDVMKALENLEVKQITKTIKQAEAV